MVNSNALLVTEAGRARSRTGMAAPLVTNLSRRIAGVAPSNDNFSSSDWVYIKQRFWLAINRAAFWCNDAERLITNCGSPYRRTCCVPSAIQCSCCCVPRWLYGWQGNSFFWWLLPLANGSCRIGTIVVRDRCNGGRITGIIRLLLQWEFKYLYLVKIPGIVVFRSHGHSHAQQNDCGQEFHFL